MIASIARQIECAALCLIALAMGGCPEQFSADERVARVELLQIAPAGSDARKALPELQRRGFVCSWTKAALFKGVEVKRDYLYCDLSRGFLVSRRWQLALVHDDFKVADAAFGIGLVGP